jgi:hypothetical protein
MAQMYYCLSCSRSYNCTGSCSDAEEGDGCGEWLSAVTSFLSCTSCTAVDPPTAGDGGSPSLVYEAIPGYEEDTGELEESFG